MSTSYYRLAEPFTSLRLEEWPGHDRLTVFESHANCGTLTMSRGHGRLVAMRFASRDGDDSSCPMRTHWGGADVGAVVDVNESGRGLADDITLISEYGDVLTVGEVKARAGARRADGWPTELFGYEKKVGA